MTTPANMTTEEEDLPNATLVEPLLPPQQEAEPAAVLESDPSEVSDEQGARLVMCHLHQVFWLQRLIVLVLLSLSFSTVFQKFL